MNNIQYIRFPIFSTCRLGNQLYFILQLQKYNNENEKNIVMICEKNIYDKFVQLNIKENIISEKEIKNNIKTLKYNDVFNNEQMMARYGIDYNQSDLKKFVDNTILQSDTYKKINGQFDSDKNSNTIAISIRNGDYLSISGYSFNFDQYLTDIFSYIDCNKYCNIIVFSDDIKYSQKHYEEKIKTKFKNVVYHENESDYSDLINLALYKNKILWNSTFAYWSAYIGDVLYNDQTVYVPSMHKSDIFNGKIYQANSKWNIINVNCK